METSKVRIYLVNDGRADVMPQGIFNQCTHGLTKLGHYIVETKIKETGKVSDAVILLTSKKSLEEIRADTETLFKNTGFIVNKVSFETGA